MQDTTIHNHKFDCENNLKHTLFFHEVLVSETFHRGMDWVLVKRSTLGINREHYIILAEMSKHYSFLKTLGLLKSGGVSNINMNFRGVWLDGYLIAIPSMVWNTELAATPYLRLNGFGYFRKDWTGKPDNCQWMDFSVKTGITEKTLVEDFKTIVVPELAENLTDKLESVASKRGKPCSKKKIKMK